MIQPDRVHVLKASGEHSGRYVLYWMQAAQRAECNPALEYAVREADARRLPVVVCFGLTGRYPEANLRHYAFLIDGLRDVARRLAERGIGFLLRVGSPASVTAELALDAALLIVDRGYLAHQRVWRRQLADAVACPVVEIEGEVVVPVKTAYPREAYSAAVLRRKIGPMLERFLVPLETRGPETRADRLDLGDLPDWTGLLDALDVDRAVAPVPGVEGGTEAGMALLEGFVESRLADYAERRNDPAEDRQSGLSPYLHFGHVAPVRIASRVAQAGGPGAEAFLEELIVRRELAVNYVWYSHAYDVLDGLPAWARATLEAHAGDPREHVYTVAQFEQAETHDPYWNAAQKELRVTGRMHGYMRMYWGKKILEWSPTPEAALDVALRLNNRYGLDGRDPNSYAGVAWCLGKHDRPWKERPIFGTVRYMNAAGLERKFDIGAYVARIGLLGSGLALQHAKHRV